MKNAQAAFKRAVELFKSVQKVEPWTDPKWCDGGSYSWRVTCGDGSVHWLSRTGRHEEEICCAVRT